MKPAGESEMTDLYVPTEVGEAVRFVGYGGAVTQWMAEMGPGVVARFTRAGNPVVRFEHDPVAVAHTGRHELEVTDTCGCARIVDGHGRLLRATDDTRRR